MLVTTQPEGAVRVYMHKDYDGTPDGYGSGALISPTLVLTNWHVVEGRRSGRDSIQVRFPDGHRQYATVKNQSKVWDLALLQIPEVKYIPFKLGQRPSVGQQVNTHGFGYDYEYRESSGHVSSRRMFLNTHPDDFDFFEIKDISARLGDSGGPVTNEYGNLVGLVFGTGKNRTKVFTHAVAVDRIQKVFKLEQKAVKWKQ